MPYIARPNSVGMSLQISNLSYSYPDGRQPTLNKLHLNIAPGERVCVTGYNGSGKTTLVQLVAGLLDNYNGQISYDGVPRVNYDQISLRRAIGDFSSHEEIFRGTVLENITMGYDHIPMQEVVKVCEQLHVMEFIRQLPQGFDTVLLPEGRTLPRSVVTKIKLARSIISQPALLAIEEVMHNIEHDDVELIARILTDRSNPWSLLAVTNVSEFAQRCDRVVVLQQGQVVLQGTFEEVMASEHGPHIFNP
jgi:ABC-type bacteriocin/lantibiotic exporter with double-glycine peptidase domain